MESETFASTKNELFVDQFVVSFNQTRSGLEQTSITDMRRGWFVEWAV
jgi:hypothetical protein